MPLDNPNLPYKVGDYTFATLPSLPHGDYPPGLTANSADQGPVYVSPDGTEWLRAGAAVEGEAPEAGPAEAFALANILLLPDQITDTEIDMAGDTTIHSLSTIAWNDTNLTVTALDASGSSLRRLYLEGLNALQTADLSNCADLTHIYLDAGLSAFDCSGCPALVELGLFGGAGLETVSVAGCSALEDLAVNLQDCEMLDCSGCSSLVSIASMSASPNLVFVDLSGCAFPEAAVDTILDSLVQSAAENGTLDLSGGTNAPPSAGGLADKATLEGAGWTVTVNS